MEKGKGGSFSSVEIIECLGQNIPGEVILMASDARIIFLILMPGLQI